MNSQHCYSSAGISNIEIVSDSYGQTESDGIGERWNWKVMENKTIEAQGD